MMKLKREKITELMNEYTNGNFSRFARILGIDPSHLHRFLKSDIGGGKKIVGAIMKFCKDKGLSFEEYVDL
jgi:hypothetical protein